MDEKEAQALGRTRKRKAGEANSQAEESQIDDSQGLEEEAAEPPVMEESQGSD